MRTRQGPTMCSYSASPSTSGHAEDHWITSFIEGPSVGTGILNRGFRNRGNAMAGPPPRLATAVVTCDEAP